MKRLRLALMFCNLLLLVSGVLAQSSSQPVYAFKHGDLWKFNLAENISTQLTDWGYNSGPILSPDGSKLVYLSTTAEFVAQYNAGTATQTGGSAPANIWLMNIATEHLTLIADQADAGATGYLRSLPVWSPDSQKLAWLQLDPSTQALDAATLKVHDIGTGATSILVDAVNLGFQDSNIRMPSLRWGAGGIARLHFTYPQAAQNPFLFVEFYDPITGALTQYDLGLNENRDNTVRDFVWVDHLGSSLMALQIKDYWEILNPYDGARLRLADPPRLKNRSISGALQLIPASVANESGGWDIHWYATTGANFFNTGYESARVNLNYLPALSPDGTEMAWHSGGHLSAWRIGISDSNRALASDESNRRTFPIPQPVSLAWAPTVWVTTGAIAGVPALTSSSVGCGLLPLLSAGQQAIVAPELTMRVRDAASVDAEALGSILEGAVVSIEAGPVCADGYNWYSVQNDELAGWTAEGSLGEYWLLYHVACSESPLTRLTTNMTATVSGDRTVNIRDGAGTTNTQVAWAVVTGDELLITGLPQCGVSGLRWYPIQFDQVSGWIAEGQGEEYWIEPVES